MVFGGILIYALMWLIRCVLKDPTPDTSNEDRISQDLRDFSSLDIKAVPGSGRRLSSASMLGREITVFRETARPYKEPMFVDKSRISMVEGSGHWTQGFLEKDPTSCTYTTYGTESGTPTTALAVGTNEQPQIGSGNLTLAMVVARDRDEKFAARRAELQDLAQLAQVVDDEGSPVRAGMKKRMVESESTSTLGHVFLRSRDNA